MNLKHLISRIWAFFASLLFVIVLGTESFAADGFDQNKLYKPGDTFVMNYAGDIVFSANYGCAAGSYAPDGGTECVTCPAGYYCLADAQPVLCPAGKYCEAGTTSESGTGLVAAGYYSTGGAKVQNPQSAEDCVGDDNTCGLIVAGYWGEAGATTSTGSGKVAAGYYNLGGGTSATPEVRGKGCVNISTTQCGTVAPGYWGEAGATQYGGTSKVAAGYYSTGGATSSTPSASDCVGKVAIIENGKLIGASDVDNTCGQVQAGYWNNACGINATGGVCSASYQGGVIAAGHWGTAGATDSAGSGLLTPGYYSTGGATVEYPDPNQCVGNNTCGAVAAGYWNNGGGTSANGTCVSGKSCGTVNGGYYSTGGGTSATPTAAGNGCLANKSCGKLSAEYYSNGGSTDNGATCVSGKTCGTCNANYRANTETGKTSASQCQASCAAGTRVATVNAACTSPAGGWFSAAHLVNYGQISPVNYCMSGYASASTSASGHDAKSDCVQTIAGGKYVPSSKINARYIKVTSDGSVDSPDTHMIEIQAFASNDGTGTNLLSGKGGVAGSKLTAATNGDWTRKTGEWYAQGNVLTWDLGSVQALGSLKFAMYTDGREYQNVAIAVSEDNTTYTTVFTATKLLTQNTTTPTGELVVLSAAPKSCAAGTSKASDTVALGNTTTCGTCANWTYSASGAATCTACPAVESGYTKLDSTGTGWTTYQKCVEIATASPVNCASGKLQKVPTASGATTWATATVNADNPLVAKTGYVVRGTACLLEDAHWVSFETNGGSGVQSVPCTVETSEIILPAPTKTGYTFDGWYQNADLTGDKITRIAQGTCLSDYTLYAKWTVNTYTVTLDANGGTGGSASVTATFNQKLPTATMPTKDGYKFNGYYSAQTGGDQYYDMNGTPVKVWSVDEAATLYAQWTAVEYDITLNANGGIGVSNMTCTVESSDIKLGEPTKTGYTFAGWYQNADLTGDAITKITQGTCLSDYTLYAKWTVIERNITLNANGGVIVGGSSVTPSTCTVESTDVDLPAPTKTGYTFDGWYQNADLTGDEITNIAQGTCVSNYTLYAKWTVNTYTVTLDANGGTGGDTSVTATYDELLPAINNLPSQEGYDFNGYWSAKTGGDQYYDMSGKALKKWSVDESGTLYAQWTARGTCAPGTYYNEETGAVETCPAGSYCAGGTWGSDGNGCAIESCPTDYPYSVAGASEEGQCYKKTSRCWCSDDTERCESKDATLCSYNKVSFQGVTYKSNPSMCVAAPGSSDSTYCEITMVYCQENAYYTPTGDIENGSCVSCSTLSNGEFNLSKPNGVKYIADSATGSTACYKKVNLPCTAPVCPLDGTGTCTYNASHSVVGGGFLFYGTDDPLPGVSPAYVCPDASFTCNTGYDKNENADIDPTDGSASAPKDLCMPHVYTFTLDPNGGETSVGEIYEKYNTGWYSDPAGTTEIAKVALPVRQYYTFAGYYTKKTALEGGVQAINSNGVILDNYKPSVAANTTLYAWWKANTYTVKYVANQATGTMASVEHTADTPKTLTPNAFTHTQNNHEFVGWARTATATEPEFSNNQEVENLTDVDKGEVVLYPVWKACTACAAGNGATCVLTAPIGVCTYTTTCNAHYENLQNSGKHNPTCSAVKYAINMETNGGVISSDYTMVSQCTVESDTIELPTAAQISQEDNRFEGWYDNANFTGSTISSIPAGGCTAKKTLYAKWAINVVKCEPGKYYNGTSSVTCPKGYYCPGEGKVTMGVAGCRTACPSGYDDGGTGYVDESECLISVPQGSYLATAKGAETTVCPTGEYTSATVLVSYGSTSSCTACEKGNYCSGGTKYSCANETDGVFANSAANSDDINDCYTVTVAGKYISGNVVKTCAAPYYCPGDIRVSYGNSGGNSSCADLSDDVEWKSGITASGASTPDMCYVQVEDGYYWNGSAFMECKAGTYKTGHSVYYNQTSSCVTCPAGYTSEAGASECYLITSAGKYVATAGQGEVECKAGDFCLGNVKVMASGVGGNTACATLAGGKYSMSASGTKTADMCYSESCASTANATAMSGKDYYGASVADTCVATLCKAGFTVVDGACSVCPENNVCNPAKDAGKPYTCSELTGGVYTKSAQQTGTVDECYLTTSAGKYVAAAGQGEVECKANGYCTGGIDVKWTAVGGREACPADYAMSEAGAAEMNQCYANCALYLHATQMAGKDYYGTGIDTCEAVQCETGFVLANGTCGSCPANSVCDPNYDNGKPHSCHELTGGKYTMSGENSFSVNMCYMITTPGNYVEKAGQGEKPCKAGDYCSGGDKVMHGGTMSTGGSESCSNFGAGYSSAAGASAETQCRKACEPDASKNALKMSGYDYYGTDATDTCEIATCQAGFYLLDGKCEICTEGFVCNPDKQNGTPIACSALTGGVYTKSNSGAGSVDECYLTTTAGMYVSQAKQSQTTCPAGSYCREGITVHYGETNEPASCPAGYAESDAGAVAAEACYKLCDVKGDAQEVSGRDYYGTEIADTCDITMCKPGYTLDEYGKCVICPENHICNPTKQNGTPVACSALTTWYTKSDEGSSTVTDCYLDTKVGMYVAKAGTDQQVCEKNGFCEGDSRIYFGSTGGRKACSADYPNADEGSTREDDCYKACAVAENAYEMSGRDYHGAGKDTCIIELCQAGYTVSAGVCKMCPENAICRPEYGKQPQSCQTRTNGTHVLAAAGSDEDTDCYTPCEMYDIEYGKALPVAETEFYPTQCQFYGVSKTGNPCDIVNGRCEETSCNYNFEMIGGVCAACERENALSYKRGGGNCIVETCVAGYHPNGQSCEVDVIGCSAPNAVAAERVWDTRKQAFGECVISECDYGYHLDGNVCQADEQICVVEHGVGVREWNHKINKWGDCIATKCDPGYTNDSSQTNELWKQCGRCNNMYSAGGELAASSYVEGCEIATCMYEGELYTLENNECILICDTYSDETGSRKWNASRKKCESTCAPGYRAW